MTIIKTPEWMFGCPIEHANQYLQAIDENGNALQSNVPIYLNGLAYAGIIKQSDLAVINAQDDDDDSDVTTDSEGGAEQQQESVLFSLTKQAAG